MVLETLSTVSLRNEEMDERNEKGCGINPSAVSISTPLGNMLCSNDSKID